MLSPGTPLGFFLMLSPETPLRFFLMLSPETPLGFFLEFSRPGPTDSPKKSRTSLLQPRPHHIISEISRLGRLLSTFKAFKSLC